MKLIIISLFNILAICPALAFANNDLVGIEYHLDQTSRQDDPLTTIVQSPTLSKAFELALQYFGVDPKVTSVALMVAKKVVVKSDGNDTSQQIPPPAGYSLCAAWVGVNSHTGGSRFSFIFDSASNIEIAAKTPSKDWTQGSQWIDAKVKVLWVKNELAQTYRNKGACFIPPVIAPNERFECGDVARCQEYHLGKAFPVTATSGNYILRN